MNYALHATHLAVRMPVRSRMSEKQVNTDRKRNM